VNLEEDITATLRIGGLEDDISKYPKIGGVLALRKNCPIANNVFHQHPLSEAGLYASNF